MEVLIQCIKLFSHKTVAAQLWQWALLIFPISERDTKIDAVLIWDRRQLRWGNGLPLESFFCSLLKKLVARRLGSLGGRVVRALNSATLVWILFVRLLRAVRVSCRVPGVVSVISVGVTVLEVPLADCFWSLVRMSSFHCLFCYSNKYFPTFCYWITICQCLDECVCCSTELLFASVRMCV